MTKFKIFIKPPFHNNSVWAGPGTVNSTLPVPENSRDKTKREYVGTRLENLTGKEPTWRPRQYFYLAELTEEQAEEVREWDNVRRVEPND